MESRKWLALAFLACGIVAMIAGCAGNDETRADINSLQTDMYSLQSQVQALQNRLRSSKKSASARDQALSTIRTSQAGVVDQLSTMQTSVNTLSGQLDQQRHFVQSTLADLSSETAALANRVNGMQASLAAQDARITALENTVKSAQGQLPASGGAVSSANAAAAQKQNQKSPKAAYNKAFKDFEAKDYSAARKGFTDFLADYPHNVLAGNAQFWIAETYYAQAQYDQAILAYEGVLKNYPHSLKAPAALLKQGMAFLETHDDKVASAILHQVMDKYPGSREAGTAKSLLAGLRRRK